MNFTSLISSPFGHPDILVAGTLLFFLLGWLWYNPITPLGQKWLSYVAKTRPKDRPPTKKWQFALMILLQAGIWFIITHTVMILWIALKNAWLSDELSTLSVIKVFMWFVFIKDIAHWYFEWKPFGLVLIGIGYYLIGIIGVCGILALFL